MGAFAGLHKYGCALAAALALIAFFTGVNAQTFPSRPITVIVPFSPGPAIETGMRAVASEASKTLGQPVLIDNRPGANGRLGINAIKAAAADGYTLAVATEVTLVIQPLSDPAFRTDIGKDYVPVTFVTDFPILLAANRALPFKDVKGLIAYAKANPGKINFAYGIGSASHFTAELFREVAGIDATMVPYKDSNQALLDLAAGRVDLMFTGAFAKPFIDKGSFIGIATTGTQRWQTFPSLPTFGESGSPVVSRAWFVAIGPAATPAETIAKLNQAFIAALKSPAIAKQFSGYGFSTGNFATAEEFRALLKSEEEKWGPVVRKARITF